LDKQEKIGKIIQKLVFTPLHQNIIESLCLLVKWTAHLFIAALENWKVLKRNMFCLYAL